MADREPPWEWPRTAYVHVPFCAHKCGYCDFASLAGSDHLADRYLEALERELATLGTPQSLDSLFIGGGTPTRLDHAQLAKLLSLVKRWLPLQSEDAEWTVEANPGTIDREKVKILRDAGVNRVSLGAQSFRPASLTVLERNHEPAEVARAVVLVAPHFRRWSLDLIFGVPGSSLSDWETDLQAALALGPDHLSCYGLSFEKGTRLDAQRRRGEVLPLEDDVEREMFAHTMQRLAAHGFRQYEISNYARPGQESTHNLAYWANDAYFGFGLGAARYVRGVRSINTRDLPAYLKRVEAGADATGPTEQLDPEPRARETAVLMLRRTHLGLQRADFQDRTGFSIDELAADAIERNQRRSWLDDDGQRLLLTTAGKFYADSVCGDFL